MDPLYKIKGPPLLILSVTAENLPVTCMVVLTVSMGMRKMRKSAAAVDAATVLAATGKSLVCSMLFKAVKTPVLAAAVYDQRERGVRVSIKHLDGAHLWVCPCLHTVSKSTERSLQQGGQDSLYTCVVQSNHD